MGYIKKLLSGVSAISLLLAGATGVRSNVPPRNSEVAKHNFDVQAKQSDLLVKFLAKTKQPYTRYTLQVGMRQMFYKLRSDQVQQVPKFAKELRDLGLSKENEIAAVETLLAMIEELSQSIITERMADLLIEQIFDQYVGTIEVAQTSVVEPDKVDQDTVTPQDSNIFTSHSQAASRYKDIVHDVQLAQSGVPAPEYLETFPGKLAPELLETQFRPGYH